MNRVIHLSLKVVVAIFLMWLAYIAFVLLHQHIHATVAWLLGFKASPFHIVYGALTWDNVLYLANVTEGVNYQFIALIGHPYQAAAIAFAAPFILDFGAVVLGGLVLQYHKFRSATLAWFIFWLVIWNLGECYSYFVIRAFSKLDDIGYFTQYLKISPWWIFVPSFFVFIWAYHICFSSFVPKLCKDCRVHSLAYHRIFFLLTVFFLMVFVPLRPLGDEYNEITHLLSYISLMAVPFVLYAYWPRRKQEEIPVYMLKQHIKT